MNTPEKQPQDEAVTPVEAAPAPEKKKAPYKGFSFKEKLLPSILLAILAPLTVCFIAPFEIYGSNTAEFKFVLTDFLGLCLLIALDAALALFLILIATRGRVFDVAFGLIYGLSLMFFLQSNYLSLGQTSLAGDGTSEGLPLWKIILNTALWIIIPLACVLVMLLLNRFKETIRLVATMALVIMLFMSFVSFLTVSLTTDVFATDKGGETDLPTVESTETDIPVSGSDSNSNGESTPQTGTETVPGTNASTDTDTDTDTGSDRDTDSDTNSATVTESDTDVTSESESETTVPVPDIERLLTVENLNTLASEKNIVVFLVDRFDRDYYYDALEACPEIFDELTGFTYFDDYISLYPRTYPAITHLVTGVETKFTTSRLEYFQTAYQKSPIMNALKDAGYDINIYTDTYYAYENAAHMAGYTQNLSHKASYKVINRPGLSLDMLRLSLYRSLPSCLTSIVGNISTPTFNKYVEYDSEYDVYSTDMKNIYEALTSADFTLRDTDKAYSFIHMSGCHLPNVYDENFDPIGKDDKYSAVVAMKQSFKIINTYIREMKRLGVYEDATILILGDHASIGSDRKDPYYAHMTALLVKPEGASTGKMTTSKAPIATEDIHATILHAAGLSLPDIGDRTVFDIPENEIRTRRYYFQRTGDAELEFITYEITGIGYDFDNWRIVDRHYTGGKLYD